MICSLKLCKSLPYVAGFCLYPKNHWIGLTKINLKHYFCGHFKNKFIVKT